MVKILISTLLLLIIAEINASGIDREGSSQQHGDLYPQLPGSHTYPADSNSGEPTTVMTYEDSRIGLWLDDTRTQLRGVSRLTDHLRKNYIPTGTYRKTHNFVTRAVIEDHIRFVVYIEDGKVLGAKLSPQLLPRSRPSGIPSNLNPDESTWFITYGGKDFKVKQDPATRIVEEIKLMPNNLIPIKIYRDRFKVQTFPVTMGGITFLVHKRSDGKIVGAQLQGQFRC